ncbi:MAG TPA: diacylglycerol kinase family protein, partial [Candidatus Acidoferrales bacterium]|nr:diacylglycerol kinase family protein [Candidatus Acidoferrales bacterium]
MPHPEEPHYARIAENRFWRSFHHAFEGIMYATRTQFNMRVHLAIAALVLVATLLLRLDRPYVIAVVVLIALVLSLELLNTAIEAIVDLLTVTHHPLAKTAKDAAAGAVLVGSIGAALAGY